jgi:hypothetical protein
MVSNKICKDYLVWGVGKNLEKKVMAYLKGPS